MMSELLKRLQREFSVASDPLVRAELLAGISGNLARLGRLDEARQCVAELRRDYGGANSGPATVWIMLAEGLIHLYGDLSQLALDRVVRAQMLSLAMKYPAATALASAWRAHLECLNSNFETAAESIRLGIQYSAPENHDSQVRLAMVLSNAFMLSGDPANAQVWFTNARYHAVKNGDQASIEAILYNRSAFGICRIRSDRYIGLGESSDLTLARNEVESAINLQNLTRINVLTHHIHLWGARLSILEGEFEQAIAGLARYRLGGPFADQKSSQEMIDLETSYCLAKMGKINEALLIFESVDLEALGRLDIDEQLAAVSMQSELETLSPRFRRGEDTQGRLSLLKTRYINLRSTIKDSFSEWATQ